MQDTPNQPGNENFRTTRWTLISEAGNPGHPLHDEALSDLLNLYRPALRSHLVNRRRMEPHKADDLLQEFILKKILQYNLIQRADRSRGKFRTLLLTALDNFARGINKPAPLSLDLENASEPADDNLGPDASFDIPWARQVLQEALRRMQAECRQSQRKDVWDVFDARILAPALQNAVPIAYGELVARHHLQSPAQASNVLITAKRMFERNLRTVVGEYADENEIDQEISELREILSRPQV